MRGQAMERSNSNGISSRFKWILAAVLALPLLVYGSINTLDLLVANRLDVDNVRIDGNTISTLDTNGDLLLSPNGTGLVAIPGITANRAIITNGTNRLTASAVTSTELGFLSGITSSVQTQLDAKQARSTLTTKGDLYVATGAATVVRQGVGTNEQTLIADSAQTNGIKWGTLQIAGGGTGQVTANAALNALLPTQTGNSGKYLKTDGSNSSWSDTTIQRVVTKTSADSPYTATLNDDYIIANTSGGNITINFPSAASSTGKVWHIKKSSNSNKVILDGNGAENIDLDATIDLIKDRASITIYSDGTQLNIRAIKDPWLVDANISGADVSLGAVDVTAYTGLTNGSLSLTNNLGSLTAQIACATTTASSGLNCNPASESVGIAFIPPRSMDVLACVSFGVLASVTAVQDAEFTFQVVETPNNAQTISEEANSRVPGWVGNGATAMRVGLPYRLCGRINVIRTDSTTYAATLRLFYEMNQTGGGTYSISADGDVNSGQLDIHWEIYPLN